MPKKPEWMMDAPEVLEPDDRMVGVEVTEVMTVAVEMAKVDFDSELVLMPVSTAVEVGAEV